MSGHTKGPWEWRNGQLMRPDSAIPILMAHLAESRHGIGAVLAVLDENKPLIVAAPELLAALSDAVTIIERYADNPADCVRRLQAWLTGGCAALAKAEGK